MARYGFSFETDKYGQGEWWLEVLEALNGDWEQPVLHGWQARYQFVGIDGEPVLRSVEIEPRGGARWTEATPLGVTARLLRELRIGEAYDATRAFLADQLEQVAGRAPTPPPPSHTGPHRGWAVHAAGYRVADALKEPRRPGRRGRDDAYFAAFAAEYAELVAQGSRKPVAVLAERRHLSPEYVRDVLNQARDRELLTRPPRGKAGGRLTDKARALLANPKEK